MQAALALDFDWMEASARLDRVEPRVWKTILTRLLARSGEGMVVCDADFGVLFATARAVHLLRRLGSEPRGRLPEHLVGVMNEQLRSADATRFDRLPAVGGGSAVLLHAEPLAGLPPARAVLFLREEVLRDDALYAVLKETYAMSWRGFQLAQLVRKGLSNRQIAERLRLSEATVKVYLHQLYRDCRVSSRTGLIALLERSTPR
jgi:DNA-binding CsgD family transcriptional regulator